MANISSPINLLQVSNLDSKLGNWYVSGANIVVETIPEYLARVTINRRSPATLVAMLIPKSGYTSQSPYPYLDFTDALANYDCKLYYFKGGLQDINFVEFIITSTDELVKYDAVDPVAGYLSEKIIAGTNVTISEGSGADENKLVISASGGGGSEYLWYLHQKSVPPISEPTNVQITVNGTGSVQGPIPEGGFVVWAVNEYGSTLPVDVPAFDLLTDSTEAVITWDAVEGATGYIVTSPSDASAHWEVEGTSVNLLSMPVWAEVTIPTENTTGLTGITIENGDLVDVVGEGIDVEFSEDEEDSTKKIVTLKKQQSDWNEEDTESPNYIANKPTIPEGGGGGGIRSTGAFLAGFSLSSGTIQIGLTDIARIYWCQVSWVLLDNDDGNGDKEDGGVIDILVGYDNNGQAFVHTANEITFTSSRISGMSIAVDSDVGSMIVNSLTLNVTFVGDSNPYMFICNSRYDQEEIPEDPL